MGGQGDVSAERGLEWSKFCFVENVFVENEREDGAVMERIGMDVYCEMERWNGAGVLEDLSILMKTEFSIKSAIQI